MGRKIGAVVLGAVIAFVVVAAVEGLGHTLYPPPADLDVGNAEQMREYIGGLGAPELLFPLAAWILGTLVGGLVACAVAAEAPMRNASMVAVLVFAATLVNFVSFPHPLWMIIGGVVGIPLAAFVAARLGKRWER